MYIGQECVCIDNNHTEANLVKDKTYVVLGIKYCPKCNCECIDVGLKIHKLYINCLSCNTQRAFNSNSISWLRSTRFVPIDYTNAQQVTFKEIEEPIFAN